MTPATSTPATTNSQFNSILLAVVLASVGALAWIVRSVDGLRHPDTRKAGDSSWFSRDPDGLYHARRVERALDDGIDVAEVDPRLNFPEGARIPWPPYYDLVLSAVIKPLINDRTPANVERRAFIERAVASAPRLFGLISALIATLAGWRFGRVTGALIAGGYFALCRGSINYSVIGCGDHHAWISMLAASMLLVAGIACERDSLRSRTRSLWLGATLGAIAGLMIGSWVAALLFVVNFQLVLGWLLVRRARETLPGVATLGLAFHVVAALVLLPAVIASPWRGEFPWMVVNLSWFHIAELALGAGVFVPLIAFESTKLAPNTSGARAFPYIVGASLCVIALACWSAELAPARGIAEGFAWVARADLFMERVQESAPLVGTGAESGVLFLALGFGVLALPIAWAWCAVRVFRDQHDELLPWLVAVATLLPQALLQRRFADALALPMAVMLAWGATQLLARVPSQLLAAACVALAFLAQAPSAQAARSGLARVDREWVGTPADTVLGEREAFEWIDAHAGAQRDWSVLAHWDRGHAIEWVARSPSVASNFGSYIGADSYLDPSRFFLSTDLSAASRILERRRTRYIWAPSSLVDLVGSMCRATSPDLVERFLVINPDGTSSVDPRWLDTLGARLLFSGQIVSPTNNYQPRNSLPLDYLRMVHVTPYFDGRHPHAQTHQASPAGYVWERVAGAVVEARASELTVSFEVVFDSINYRFGWQTFTNADVDGIARIRVPYCNDVLNGDARVINALWIIGARTGDLMLPEHDVLEGTTVHIQ